MTLEQRIEIAKNSLAAATTDEQRYLLGLGLQKLKDLLAEQKKSEAQSQQSESPEPLPTKQEIQDWQEKAEKETKWQEIREKLPTMARVYDETIKTVKAPDFITPDELINIELEDVKGAKYVRTYTRAQVRAMARKYFSNVHDSWLGKERKIGVGFKNLLAYVVAWQEFDGALPALRDVLPDYDRYNKGGESKEASEAFKVAQELYNKIVEILNDAK